LSLTNNFTAEDAKEAQLGHNPNPTADSLPYHDFQVREGFSFHTTTLEWSDSIPRRVHHGPEPLVETSSKKQELTMLLLSAAEAQPMKQTFNEVL
jgi:hypothetical protein